MPKRIQRKRAKGWRMPHGAVYVGRPTKWGNPFTVEVFGRDLAVRLYRDALHGFWDPSNLPTEWPDEKFVAGAKAFQDTQRLRPAWDVLRPLRGHDLACWCPLVDKVGNPVPCHGDVLLEIANATS